MSKHTASLDMDIRILNADKKKLYKLSVPYEMKNASAFAEVAFGEEAFRLHDDENVHQKYVRVEGDGGEMRVYNNGIYSSSLGEDRLLISLMRSPAYCAHPVGDAEILPQDRTSPYIEQGEREFSLRFAFGKRDISCGIEAQIYNEKPVCLSFFPAGEDTAEKRPFLRLDGGKIVLVALKKAEKENAYVLRLFNPTADSAVCRLESHILGIDQTIAFSAFEVKTFRLSEGTLTEWELMEGMTD
jgi:alpha-mannosidase